MSNLLGLMISSRGKTDGTQRQTILAKDSSPGLHQGQQIGDMVGVEMREHHVPQLIMAKPRFQQALERPVSAIEEDGQSIQFQQYAGCAPLAFDLAGASAQKCELAHRQSPLDS
jgi:hypothetical protein